MIEKLKRPKNSRFLLIISELIILLAYFLIAIAGKSGNTAAIKAPLSSWKSNNIQYSSHKWHINEGNGTGDPVELLYGPYLKLPKGNYTVSIDYSSDSSQSAHPYANNGMDSFIKGGSFTLDHTLHHVSYDFRTTENLNNFELVVNYNHQGSFTISKIRIYKNNNALKQDFLWLLLIFLLIDGVLIFRKLSNSHKKITIAVLGITFLSSLPLFFSGLSGQDLNFHLMRIEGIANELRYGHFPVRISSLWMGGYGYPVSIYYGDILLQFPAILRLFGVPVNLAYKIFVFFMNLTTTVVATFFFNRMFRNRKTGVLVTLVYMTATYRLTDVYVRASAGEYSIMLFFPLIAYALWNMYSDKNSSIKKNMINGLLLGLGMAGVITSHVLSAEMITVGIILLIVLTAEKTFTLNTIRTYLIAVSAAVLLGLYFLIPFADYYKNVPVRITDIVGGVSSKIQSAGVSPAEYFSFFKVSSGDDLLRTPGIILMLTLILAFALWFKGKASYRVKVLTVFSTFMLFMASNLFPWNDLAYKFKLINMLAQVQFPWRYIMMAIFSLTVLMGTLIMENGKDLPTVKVNNLLKICAATSFVMTCFFTSYYQNNVSPQLYYDSGEVGTYSLGFGEYVRSGADVDNLVSGVQSDNAKAQILYRRGTDTVIYCHAFDKEAVINVPMFNYKGYVVKDDKGHIYPISDGPNHVISFKVPAKFKGNLHINFQSPWYWTLGLIISVISVLGTVVIFWKNRKEI